MGISDSATWKWRLIIRLFGIMMVMIPFLAGIAVSNPSMAWLSILAGFLLVMVS